LDVSTAALSRIEHVATKYYLAIADRLPHESNWSILFPAFPGVTSVAEAFADVMRQAKDALASVVEDMEKEHETLPPSIEEDAVPDYDRSPYHDPRALLVPVETAGRALRVNVSLDEGLLARIDDVSKRTGLSSSALLARGARMLIATETG
jgi:predicted RNase H-like HicB family nuclease